LPVDDLARYIDHAALAPDARAQTIAQACHETRTFGFRGLVVPTCALSQARRLLRETGAVIAAAISFPHGTCSADLKATAAQKAVESGADEIDYVISVGAARDGDFRYVREEAVAIVRAVRGRPVKAILEVGYLDAHEIVECSQRLCEAGVGFVKTCTGFGPGQATEEVVRLIAETVGTRAGVKASGGIRDRESAVRMIQAGASILGTSRGPAICAPAAPDAPPATTEIL
jgi:deoxyribose-phosphate aldolase